MIRELSEAEMDSLRQRARSRASDLIQDVDKRGLTGAERVKALGTSLERVHFAFERSARNFDQHGEFNPPDDDGQIYSAEVIADMRACAVKSFQIMLALHHAMAADPASQINGEKVILEGWQKTIQEIRLPGLNLSAS